LGKYLVELLQLIYARIDHKGGLVRTIVWRSGRRSSFIAAENVLEQGRHCS
jgi:hypothetical protein